MAIEKSMAAEEARWAAESDARTLAGAAAISADTKRLTAAQGAAKRLATDEEKNAKDAQMRADQMKKLAGKPASRRKIAKGARGRVSMDKKK